MDAAELRTLQQMKHGKFTAPCSQVSVLNMWV